MSEENKEQGARLKVNDLPEPDEKELSAEEAEDVKGGSFSWGATNTVMGDGSVRTITDGTSNTITDGTSNTLIKK